MSFRGLGIAEAINAETKVTAASIGIGKPAPTQGKLRYWQLNTVLNEEFKAVVGLLDESLPGLEFESDVKIPAASEGSSTGRDTANVQKIVGPALREDEKLVEERASRGYVFAESAAKCPIRWFPANRP